MVKILSKTCLRRQEQPGTAMLLTLLLVGAIGVILFSVSRLTIDEVRASREIRESVLSYYAAEAGLEKGLLEYRQNHDIIKDNITSNLSNGAKSTASVDYRKKEVSGQLDKDSKAEITIINPGSETLTFRFQNQSTAADAKSYVEYQRLDQVGSIWLTTKREMLDVVGFMETTAVINTLNTSKKIVLRAFGGAVDYNITTTNPHLGGGDSGVDSGISTINSTGAAGKTSRKLQAKIDRNQNQLIGIFDFTIFSQEELK
ncbi:MAG: Uncharacterized protein CEN88_474 [Candidatus Berkelbacteria bacterium Licking1014_2]|uniref:Type 4 fimbrial biogenesis protein PilX N-terminal domain-containing protein n=1 Tax=Candidatus Berkelbacteria bacterium Licking1014_2 TaxID=2017146 RepID=A0A554LRK2_9BACT|nr:MAG: Uncharacterized protein CEN88_474 [Candidatus Berkelbacteria bacterium Licking1014_2]